MKTEYSSPEGKEYNIINKEIEKDVFWMKLGAIIVMIVLSAIAYILLLRFS